MMIPLLWRTIKPLCSRDSNWHHNQEALTIP
jgi:hypothetical protein